MHSSVRRIVSIATMFFGVLGLAPALQAGTWNQGDVFLGIGGGKVRVVRLGSSPATTTLDNLSDGVGGAITGVANDNTWHLLAADAGSSTLSKVVRFAITGGVLPTPFDGSTCPLSVPPPDSTNVQSMVINGNGHILLANASPASVVELDGTGHCVQAFALPSTVIDSQLASIDILGGAIYFTSGGRDIGQLNLLTGAASTKFSLNPGSLNLLGIRVLPAGTLPTTCNGAACPSLGGFLIAAKDRILLIDSAGSTVATYTKSGQSNLSVLALDPIVSASKHQFFYVADPNSTGTFFRVNISTGNFETFNAGSGISGIQSITTYGGFSPNQPVPTQLVGTGDGDLNPGHTESFSFPGNTLTMTNYGTTPTAVTVFASAIDPATGPTDKGVPCKVTTPDSKCVVWEADFSPVPADNSISLRIVTDTEEDPTTHLFENEQLDITTSIDYSATKLAGRCLFSLNTVGGAKKGCSYFTPLDSGTLFNNPGNITFRFSCPGLSSTELTTLENNPPFLDVVQIFPPLSPTSPAPKLFFPGAIKQTGNTGNPVNQYRTGSGNSFTQNVSFKGQTGCFLATTLDLTNNILAAFDVIFGVNVTSADCPIGVLNPNTP
jgi:hypothetical protein